MKIIKTMAVTVAFGLFLIGCNNSEQPQQIATAPYPSEAAIPEDEYWAKDNLDLQRVGDILERSDNPEAFERYLNEDDGINNLDMNGDGYADYISVEEYEDRDGNSRGLSLFSRFGPDMIQEIAQVLFYRDGPDYRGSRVYIRGNDAIYGDNYYYEQNWLDRSLGLVSYLFNDHNRYESPYYYDNYPSWYSPYEIVETPYYRTRMVDLYPQPVFIYRNAVPEYWDRIKIKSPNNGLHLGQIKARMVKPTKEQAEFWKSNPRQVAKRGDKPGNPDPPRSDRGDERGNPGRDDRGAERGNPNKPDAGGNPNKGGGNPNAGGNPNKGGGNPNAGGNPNKGGGNPNKGGGNPNAGGNPNKGGGNPNKGGGGNPNKGGGGGKKP